MRLISFYVCRSGHTFGEPRWKGVAADVQVLYNGNWLLEVLIWRWHLIILLKPPFKAR